MSYAFQIYFEVKDLYESDLYMAKQFIKESDLQSFKNQLGSEIELLVAGDVEQNRSEEGLEVVQRGLPSLRQLGRRRRLRRVKKCGWKKIDFAMKNITTPHHLQPRLTKSMTCC